MNFLKIPKYTQQELVKLLHKKGIDLGERGYIELQKTIKNDYVFNKERFLDCAEILGIPKNEIFEIEEVSEVSFRGQGAENDIESILKLFTVMVEQSKIRGKSYV